MTMTEQATAIDGTGAADPVSQLRTRLSGTNVNTDTFLATDYLNHFNEIVMLLEMVSDMPEILDDVKEWQPKTYAEHFQDSGLSDSDLAIEAYENAPAEFREPFDETISRMNAVVFKSITRIEAAQESPREDELAAAASTASRLLQRLVDVASAIIHGDTPKLEQDEIDELLGD